MGLTPHAYVTFDTPEHLHLVPLGDGKTCILETEEAAEVLAEALEICSPYRHDGHGAFHTSTQVESAYKSAIEQIHTTDFEEEWRQLQWQKFLTMKWNGTTQSTPSRSIRQVPAAIIMPIDEARKWQLVMPDPRTGDPIISEINKQTQQAIDEIIPMPTSRNSYKVGVGYRNRVKPQPLRATRSR